MVERSHSWNMPEAEAADLRIALYEQKELVSRLREELEAEREASASSASEALAMILRLQGEKATLSMEASQYKRMVEERISHVEISLVLMEDVIYQKELEITSLEHQLQAYRCKLLSLGYTDDNNPSLFVQTDDYSVRICDRSQTPSPEPVLDLSVPVEKGVIEQSLDSRKYSDKIHGDFDSLWEQMKKLDEQVKEITDFRDSLRDKYEILKQDSVTESGQGKGEVCQDFASSSNVQDRGICKRDLPAKMASKQKRLEKKGSKQVRDRNVKREREYQAELKRLRERVERLEMERTGEITEMSGVKREEETSNSVKYEVESSRTIKKSPPRDDPSLHSLQEAMLYFWI
ncbi:PREDICTED: myosin-binding protein 3-like isoform X1 [Tarenaya hassleriana]|uniref:myosin-binding protein 3-like isoform X1 n=1 Tax=Tarenaya hassleriana TaxID=28532 RepID=UPI00053C5CCF|nr:PREDICTED: myosin-binding protein 3-like isoform X1 [Tarenaya hassleriana]